MAEENSNEQYLNPSRRSYVYDSSKTPGNKSRVILIVIGIIILIALIAFAVVATGGKGEEVVPTPTIANDTPTPTETLTPTPEESPTTTPKASPTGSKGTPSPTLAGGIDRADLSIEIQNGSGVAGAATKVSDILKKLGYDISSTGNADNFDYEETEIHVKSTKKNYLDTLKKDLSDDYTIGKAASDYTGDADALVIVGKE